MSFDAKFVEISFLLSPSFRFLGKGQVHLQNVALILEGDYPKFSIPLVEHYYHRIISERTYRTVPYSTIVEYRAPGIFRRYHQIVYEDLSRRRVTVGFKLHKARENELFTARLEEYRVAAKVLQSGTN